MLAVHGGVGSRQSGVEDLCAQALQEARGHIDVAIKFLEDDGRTNCGFGASLTVDGRVELEAGFMTSRRLAFGAVGALSISRYPSVLAKTLALARLDVSSRLVAPMLVVGEGADQLAASNDAVTTCSNESLITDTARRAHDRAQAMLLQENEPDNETQDCVFDTVGACGIDLDGEAMTCTSSGGTEMKTRGRLGHSSQFGAGCWAQQNDTRSVAISLTGCGEAIITTRLAQRIGEAVLEAPSTAIGLSVVAEIVVRDFLRSPLLESMPVKRRKVGGLVLMRRQSTAELVVFHNTRHLPFAYTHDNTIFTHLSVLDTGQTIRFDSFAM